MSDPPIIEVVCGFVFEPLPQLDPVLVGAYWSERRGDYPGHQILHPLGDFQFPGTAEFEIGLGVPQIRAWFVSSDDARVLQLQHDRFYLNWRKRNGNEYPTFTGRGGRPGLREVALEELERFSEFVHAHLGSRPTVKRIELAKVDLFEEGKHWKVVGDLGEIIPPLAPLLSFSRSGPPVMLLRLADQRGEGLVTLSADFQVTNPAGLRALRLETRWTQALSGDDGEINLVLTKANRHLTDEVFAALIPADQRARRFGESQ